MIDPPTGWAGPHIAPLANLMPALSTWRRSPPQALPGHKDAVTCLAFRDGTHELYSGSLDRSIKLWSLDDMAYVDTLFGHQAGEPPSAPNLLDMLPAGSLVLPGAALRLVPPSGTPRGAWTPLSLLPCCELAVLPQGTACPRRRANQQPCHAMPFSLLQRCWEWMRCGRSVRSPAAPTARVACGRSPKRASSFSGKAGTA